MPVTFKRYIRPNIREHLVRMGLLSKKSELQACIDIEADKDPRACQHPASRYIVDNVTADILFKLPEKACVYDLGAKYNKMRKMLNQYCPDIEYHGVRVPLTSYDRSYIAMNKPNELDIIPPTWNYFYEHLRLYI